MPSRSEVLPCMKRLFSFALVCGASGVLALVLAWPASAFRQAGPRSPLLAGAHADPHVLSILERSCQNCHSSNTEWPLYSRIFPVSLLIARDVRAAKTHMDLSRWQTYEPGEKARLLSEIGSVVRGHIMPPRRYTFIHPAARLSDSEANEIYRWTRAVRHRSDPSRGPM
jgi:hypothetical protein